MDDSPEPTPLPTHSEALNAVRVLISYLEGQDASQTPFMRSLELLERDIEGVASQTHGQAHGQTGGQGDGQTDGQGTLDSWLRN